MSRFDWELQLDEAVAGLVPDDISGLLGAAVAATLNQEVVEAAVSLTLLLTSDAQLQQLSRDFLGIDRPTDVLSFPDGDMLPGMESVYLGDVAISVETAQRQAAARGHTLEGELQLLAVHGLLHLLGYDHAEPDEKETMWAAQAGILSTLGTAVTIPGEYDELT